MIAAEADRRQGARFALGASALGLVMALGTAQLGSLVLGGAEAWIWTVWCSIAAGAGAAAVAALVSRRRMEGSGL
jgi:hypothetical protein